MLFNELKSKFLTSALIVLLSTLVLPATGLAQNKVVVIPLFGDAQKPLKNVITVAKENGDFTDPRAAISSITDASAENPYLVVIAPGVYNLAQNRSIFVRSHVDVVGSGQNSTFLRGNIGSDSTNARINGSGALVRIRDKSSISNLTIENLGTTLRFGHGLHYNSVTLSSESASVSNITINVSSNSNSELVGIETTNADLSVLNTKIFVSAGSGGAGRGIRTRSSGAAPPFITNILNTEIEVVGAASSKIGVANTNSSGSTVKIQNSTINVPSGNVESLAGFGNNETYISNSFLSGTATGANCSFVFTLTGVALSSSCI